MDKNKIIDSILSEWAMRSHDGLASGHDTAENIETLKDILCEYGVDQNNVDSMAENLLGEKKEEPVVYGDDRDYIFKVNKPNSRTEVDYYMSAGHPNQKKYPDKSRYDGPRKYDDPKMYKVANINNISDALVKAETDPNLKDLRNKKSVSIANVQKLKKVFEAFPDQSLVKKYKALYNSIPTVQEAIEIYTGKKYPEFQGLINKIDDEKFAGGGRGEIPIVFILKGATSGGGTNMDILFAERENKITGIEVKEVTGATIAISVPTLSGFSNTKFNIAIHEIALAANNYPTMKGFLTKVLKDNGKLYKKIDKITDLDKNIKAIEDFFDDPKVGEVSKFLLDAIFIISQKLKSPILGQRPEIGSVEIDIGKKHHEFKVPDDQVTTLNAKIDNVSGEKAVLTIPVEPKKEKDDGTLAEKCMKLSFFREDWDENRVQAEVMERVLSKYKRMIVISKKKGANEAELYDSKKIKTLEFVALGFAKIYMFVPGMGKSKAQAAGDVKVKAPEETGGE